MQVAVALCACGLLFFKPAFVTAGAVVGVLAWWAMVANLGIARARAKLSDSGSGARRCTNPVPGDASEDEHG
jgi:uncharacterized membrane protein YqiK